MNRILQIGSILLLAVGVASGRHQQAKDPAPTQAKPVVKGGVPKGTPIPKGAARVPNPSNIAARLYRMSPEEREHALEKLPNEQARERARRELEWFDGLPPEEQQRQLRHLDRIAQLTPAQRAAVQGTFVELNKMPAARGNQVRLALYRLEKMSPQQREATLKGPLFQGQFTQEEIRIINVLLDAWIEPVP